MRCDVAFDVRLWEEKNLVDKSNELKKALKISLNELKAKADKEKLRPVECQRAKDNI